MFVGAGAALVIPLWLAMNLAPEATLSVMLPGMVLTADDIQRFRILMLVLPVLPIVFTALALLPAIEMPGKATLVSVSRQLLFYVPVMITLPQLIGVSGIYIGAMSIDFICAMWLLAIVVTTFRRMPSAAERAGKPVRS
jgi:Na+-driven multidrug efflux pump